MQSSVFLFFFRKKSPASLLEWKGSCRLPKRGLHQINNRHEVRSVSSHVYNLGVNELCSKAITWGEKRRWSSFGSFTLSTLSIRALIIVTLAWSLDAGCQLQELIAHFGKISVIIFVHLLVYTTSPIWKFGRRLKEVVGARIGFVKINAHQSALMYFCTSTVKNVEPFKSFIKSVSQII